MDIIFTLLILFIMFMGVIFWVGFWFELSNKNNSVIWFSFCFSMAVFSPVLLMCWLKLNF